MAAVALVGNMIAPGGVPASGCLLTSYLRNTTTKSPLYSNVGLSTPTENPFEADADGRLDFYFDSTIDYSWSVTTADGGTILWQADVVGGVVSVTYSNGVLIHGTWHEPLATALGSGWQEAFAQDIDEILDDAKGIRVVATYAEMTALTADELTDGCMVYTKGRAAAGDGGHGEWRWVAGSSTTADSGTVLAHDTISGRFFRLYTAGIVSAAWFGSLSSAFSATLALAITAAGVGGYITVPPGNYTMTAGVTPLAGQTIVFLGHQFNEDYATAHPVSVTRGFDGVAFSRNAAGNGIKGLNWDGAGATFSGVCFYISGGQQQWDENCDIDDQQDACLHFDGADAGERYKSLNSHFRRTTGTNPAIVGTTTVDTSGNRMFIGARSYGGVLMQINKMVNTKIIGGEFRNLDFSGSTSVGADLRMSIQGCRIATTGDDFEIHGGAVAVQGCVMAGNIVLGTDTTRCHIGPNEMVGLSVIDNSTATGANINEVWDGYYTVTPVWKGDSSDPVIGDGALGARVIRSGRKLKVQISLLCGSTTTFGSGAYYFTLPDPFDNWTAKFHAAGKARALDSGAQYYNPSAVIATGSNRIYLFDTQGVSPTVPMTWAENDTLLIDIEYEIA